jgi:hypothetical protein
MIVHVFSLFRPRRERDLIRARLIRQKAYADHLNATARQDTRSMRECRDRLVAATSNVLRLEVER